MKSTGELIEPGDRSGDLTMDEATTNTLRMRLEEVEAELRGSEQRYRHLFEANPHPMWIFDVETLGFLDVNEAALRHYGYSRAEFLSLTLRDILTPDQLPALLGWLTESQTDHRPDSEWRHRRKDSSLIDVEVASQVISFRGRDARLAMINDVTERKRAEAALRESEERLRLALSAASMNIWDWNLRTQRVTWSEDLELQLGMSPGTFDGRYETFLALVHPEDRAYVRNSVSKAIAERSSYRVEFRLLRPDGTVRWTAASGKVIYDEQGNAVRMLGTDRDITARKQVEAERERLLAHERSQAGALQKLAEASLAINSALALDDVLRLMTEAARELIGAHQAVTSLTVGGDWAQAITAVSLSDKYAAWRDYDQPPDGSGIYSLVCQTGQPMRLTQAELEAHPAWRGFGAEAGKHPPLRGWMAVPLTAHDGHNLGLIQLSDKYTGEFTSDDEAILVQLAQLASTTIENIRLYQREQAAREAAEAATRAKDEFLALVSHELRTPLNAMLGWARILRDGKRNEATIARAIEIIERNATTQMQLIEDLLDVSRIITGKLRLNVQPVEPAGVVRTACELLRPAAEARQIELNLKLDPGAGIITGDPDRLQQIVWNLVSNAIKFTEPGGRVEVGLERVDPNIRITVRDTGQGIAPEFLPFLFERFRQADASASRRQGGLGLGLALVRHLVELHGGTVRAESPGEGQGATFIVNLPLRAVRPQSNNSHESALTGYRRPQAQLLENLRVLVVDDEEDARTLVSTVLRQYGAQVTAAASAAEAFAALTSAQERPDVLVSDISMPEEDGYSLMKKIRETAPENGGLIPAVALTAYGRVEDRLRALAAGFQMHVPKPVEPEELAAVVASVAGRFERNTGSRFG
ncbi:MAG TPA: PAS domain S-box protein [Blastocatellia bacterium]|nr:PAS domain S-box protein [Blastocatellia bacterium]